MADTAIVRLGKPDVGFDDGTWGTELNATIDKIDQLFAEDLTINIGGVVTTTLTADQQDNAVLKFTGAFAAAEFVRFTRRGVWFVRHAGTGGFRLILTTATATDNVALEPGASAYIYCDGTNVYASTPERATLVEAQGAADTDSYMTPERTFDLIKKQNWTTISTLSGITGSAAGFSSALIDRAGVYTIVCQNLSHSAGANQAMSVQFSDDNGGTWSSSITSLLTVSAAQNMDMLVRFSTAYGGSAYPNFQEVKWTTGASVESSFAGNVKSNANRMRAFWVSGNFDAGSMILVRETP